VLRETLKIRQLVRHRRPIAVRNDFVCKSRKAACIFGHACGSKGVLLPRDTKSHLVSRDAARQVDLRSAVERAEDGDSLLLEHAEVRGSSTKGGIAEVRAFTASGSVQARPCRREAHVLLRCVTMSHARTLCE